MQNLDQTRSCKDSITKLCCTAVTKVEKSTSSCPANLTLKQCSHSMLCRLLFGFWVSLFWHLSISSWVVKYLYILKIFSSCFADTLYDLVSNITTPQSGLYTVKDILQWLYCEDKLGTTQQSLHFLTPLINFTKLFSSVLSVLPLHHQFHFFHGIELPIWLEVELYDFRVLPPPASYPVSLRPAHTPLPATPLALSPLVPPPLYAFLLLQNCCRHSPRAFRSASFIFLGGTGIVTSQIDGNTREKWVEKLNTPSLTPVPPVIEKTMTSTLNSA